MLYIILLTIFYLSFFVILYSYAFYPITVYFVTRWYKIKRKCDIQFTPNVSLIIAARNEEAVIEEKIKNSLNLDYPWEKFEIMVISDNSTDHTNNIVQKYQDRIKLLELAERHGKTKAQNRAVELANGEIVVFSDANAMYEKDAIRQLVKHYIDPEVGFVSGQLIFKNQSSVSNKENIYWRYDKFIKRSEDKLGCITGANGSIYSIRKDKYVPLDYDIISDFIEPLEVYSHGNKVVYETRAISYEDGSQTYNEEFGRRKRIILRSINSLYKHKHLLNPLITGILAFELISHKVLRWFCPVFMILLFFTNIFLINTISLLIFFLLQVVFYLISLLGIYMKNKPGIKSIFLAPYYFTLINYASLLAILDFFKGENKVFWEPVRQ